MDASRSLIRSLSRAERPNGEFSDRYHRLLNHLIACSKSYRSWFTNHAVFSDLGEAARIAALAYQGLVDEVPTEIQERITQLFGDVSRDR